MYESVESVGALCEGVGLCVRVDVHRLEVRQCV